MRSSQRGFWQFVPMALLAVGVGVAGWYGGNWLYDRYFKNESASKAPSAQKASDVADSRPQSSAEKKSPSPTEAPKEASEAEPWPVVQEVDPALQAALDKAALTDDVLLPPPDLSHLPDLRLGLWELTQSCPCRENQLREERENLLKMREGMGGASSRQYQGWLKDMEAIGITYNPDAEVWETAKKGNTTLEKTDSELIHTIKKETGTTIQRVKYRDGEMITKVCLTEQPQPRSCNFECKRDTSGCSSRGKSSSIGNKCYFSATCPEMSARGEVTVHSELLSAVAVVNAMGMGVTSRSRFRWLGPNCGNVPKMEDSQMCSEPEEPRQCESIERCVEAATDNEQGAAACEMLKGIYDDQMKNWITVELPKHEEWLRIDISRCPHRDDPDDGCVRSLKSSHAKLVKETPLMIQKMRRESVGECEKKKKEKSTGISKPSAQSACKSRKNEDCARKLTIAGMPEKKAQRTCSRRVEEKPACYQ